MKKVVAVIAGFFIGTIVYILVATGLFKHSFDEATPPGITCGVGTAVIIALLFNKKRMQLIPIRVKRY